MLSGYDAYRFPGWQLAGATRLDWTNFSDGHHQLRVGNVNATRLERVLGVDLIYRHIDNDTFVLVQYKKMTRDAAGNWGYRADRQLDIELERMRRVDAADTGPVTDPATWRLYAKGCFLKLVRPPTSFDPTSDRLLSGIYLPIQYLDDLLQDSANRGEARSGRLGYDTVDRYLTAGLFVDLVRQGWIGTRGLTTRAIEALVQSAIGEQHSVVVAEETGEQSGSERRRGHVRI